MKATSLLECLLQTLLLTYRAGAAAAATASSRHTRTHTYIRTQREIDNLIRVCMHRAWMSQDRVIWTKTNLPFSLISLQQSASSAELTQGPTEMKTMAGFFWLEDGYGKWQGCQG